MIRLRTLLAKEWSHHGWFFLATMPLLILMTLMLLYAQSRAELGSALNAPRFFSLSMLILFEIIVCNRLVVQEFGGKTQLFLESLPLSRLAMIGTKYVLGLVVCGVPLVACFLLSLLLQYRLEVISGRFLAILSLRLAVYLFCTYSFFFMMGLLGRYRIAIYLLLLLAYMTIDMQTDFSFRDSGPFALVNDRFPFERFQFPWSEILGCSLAGAGFVAASTLMATSREGSVAAMLSEKMTSREKSFISIGLLTVMFISSTLHAKKTPAPYDIESRWEVIGDGVTVKAEETLAPEIAPRLVERVHQDLLSVKEYLRVKKMPPVFLVGRDDLDGSQHEVARLVNAAGVLFRINPSAEDWDEDAFRSYILDVVLSEATNYHAIRERQCWVLEGFVQYWIEHLNSLETDHQASLIGQTADPIEQAQALSASDSIQDLRAAYGFSLGFVPNDSDDWYRYRERVGEPIASAVACRGLKHAEQKYGKNALREFLRETLRSDFPDDSRSLWTQWRRPIERVCQDWLDVDYAEFREGWIKDLESIKKRHAAEINKISKVEIRTSVDAPAGLTRYLDVAVEMSPPPTDGLIKLQYESIGVVNVWQSEDDVSDHVKNYEADSVVSIPETYSPGDRIRVRAVTFSEPLGCDVASPWQRMEIQ